jgi:hypothetical protein
MTERARRGKGTKREGHEEGRFMYRGRGGFENYSFLGHASGVTLRRGFECPPRPLTLDAMD